MDLILGRNKFMSGNKRVMIIEDDTMLAEFYAMFIKREFNIESDIYTTGDEVQTAIDEYGVERWVFFLCDLNIPLHSSESMRSDIFQGFELIETLLPPCRVIIASGYISPEIAKESLRLGVVSIFQKPPNFNALAIIMNFLINCMEKKDNAGR